MIGDLLMQAAGVDAVTAEITPGPRGAIGVARLLDGAWIGAFGADLANNEARDIVGGVFAGRDEAMQGAAEGLIEWCGHENGSTGADRPKKHREQATKLQEWALEQSRVAREAIAERAVAPVEREELPGERCGKCNAAMLLPLMGGTRHGLLVCPVCDAAEIEAHRAEGAPMTPAQEAEGLAALQSEDTGTQDDLIPAPVVDAVREHLENQRSLAEEIAPGDKRVKQEAPPQTLGIQLIPIEQIHESRYNPRQVFSEEGMQELVESMRASGFNPWQPALVRPREIGEYENATAHRRIRAAREAGIALIPCVVRQMSEKEFFAALNFDNGGREDVHSYHEALGWRFFMDETGATVEEVAKKAGISERAVYDRLKLLDLIPEAVEEFIDGRLNHRNAVAISRLTPELQGEALDFCCPSWDPDRVVTTRQVEKWIENRTRIEEPEPRSTPAPVEAPIASQPKPLAAVAESAPPAPEIPAGPSLNQVIDSQREADRARDKAAQDRKEFDAKQKAIDDKARADAAAAEAKRRAREQRIYRRTVEAICGAAKFPVTREVLLPIAENVIDMMDSCDDVAEMFNIPVGRDGGTVIGVQNVVRALQKMPADQLLRVFLAALLLDEQLRRGNGSNVLMTSLAGAYRVDHAKIAKAVDEEMTPKPAKLPEGWEFKKGSAYVYPRFKLVVRKDAEGAWQLRHDDPVRTKNADEFHGTAHRWNTPDEAIAHAQQVIAHVQRTIDRLEGEKAKPKSPKDVIGKLGTLNDKQQNAKPAAKKAGKK